MNITIQSVHFKASDRLKDHVQEKVRKLFDLNERIIRADVTLVEDGTAPKHQHCEIKLSIPGNDLIAKKSAASYELAVSDTVDTLLKTMRRKKKA